MSTTLSTSAMVAELSRRVPLGFTATLAMDALNGAMRWINQQGSFPWLIRKADAGVTLTTGALALPADYDPGKKAVLYGTEAGAVPTEIPFMPWDVAVKQQSHQSATAASGLLSCWSYYAEIAVSTVTIKGQVFPASAAKTENLSFVYHTSKFPALTSGASTYFPTPDHFDYLIVELAESELMRQSRLVGWDILYKRVTDQLRAMLDAYRTTSPAMAPTSEVVNIAQVKQAQRAS